jgi:phosphatidylcholine synthase
MSPPHPGFLVHSFTASGAAVGFAALVTAAEGQFTATFALLGLALLVDALDGPLARHFRIAETSPHIDGVALDLVVDFLTYVVVPLIALWRSDLLSPPLSVLLPCVVCAASAIYFADRRMKTEDYWFRGFPAVWNLTVFYLLVLRPGPLVSAFVIGAATIGMFTPIIFVHPLRVKRLRPLTLIMTGVWGVAAIAALVQNLAEANLPIKIVLVATGAYVLTLPLFRAAPHGPRDRCVGAANGPSQKDHS